MLHGFYNKIIISPLARCLDTLNLSKIKYDDIKINYLVREYIENNSDVLENEEFVLETKENLLIRINKFKKYLLTLNYDRILVVTHSEYIWNFTTKYVGDELFGMDVNNAEIVEYKFNNVTE